MGNIGQSLMPSVERVFDTAIDGWEYGYDPVNQAATITTRFQIP